MTRARRKQVGGHAAMYVLGVLAGAALLGAYAWLLGVRADVEATRAELVQAQDGQRALAEQVRRLGGRPVVSPPPPGAQGERGLQGLRGPQGIQGAPGRPPSAGELLAAATRALAANPPAPGKDGTNGRDGTDGVNGQDGADGQDGAQGPQGIQGEKGDTGDQGPIGPAGPSCPDGWHQAQVTVLTASGPQETTTCVRDEASP